MLDGCSSSNVEFNLQMRDFYDRVSKPTMDQSRPSSVLFINKVLLKYMAAFML